MMFGTVRVTGCFFIATGDEILISIMLAKIEKQLDGCV